MRIMAMRLFSFVGGADGPWCVRSAEAVAGAPLAAVSRLKICAGSSPLDASSELWALRGITSNERYVVGAEKAQLVARQQPIARPEATCAALIPIRKISAWWALPQDRRRHILEERSRHIEIGLTYLPAIARRLHHCRDLGEDEPFDFLTWFEFAPAHRSDFDQLVNELRASEEWSYVDREVDIRLERDSI